MARIVAVEYLSLDGVFENPAWTQPYFDEAVGDFQREAMQWADALLMGRVTYDGMSQAWPATGNDPSTGGDIMNSIGKYVPTSTLSKPTWNATFLSGDVVESVTRLKAGEENLVIYGSGELTETLRAAGLIDEYRLGCSSAPSCSARDARCSPAVRRASSPSSTTAPPRRAWCC